MHLLVLYRGIWKPTIINESDDLELLPHEHLDIDGGNENRKTIKDTMSSKEFLDTILHFSASFTAVAFPVKDNFSTTIMTDGLID